MQQRLISENILQCNYTGSPYFSAQYKYIVFYSSNDRLNNHSCLKIKTFTKQIKELVIPLGQQVAQDHRSLYEFFFTQSQGKIYLIIFWIKQSKLEILAITDNGKQILMDKIKTIQGVVEIGYNSDKLIFIKEMDTEGNFEIQGYFYSEHKVQCLTNQLKKQQFMKGTKLTKTQGNIVFLMNNTKQNRTNQIVKCSAQSIIISLGDYYQIFGIYQDRFIFMKSQANKEVEIFDIMKSKIIGKFLCSEGTLIHHQLQENILLLVYNQSNLDKYCFYVLANDYQKDEKKLVTKSCTYEKGKGSFFEMKNCNKKQATIILQGKQKNGLDTTSSVSLVYMIPKNKEKIQVMKIFHEKIHQYDFTEETMDVVIQSKVKSKEIKSVVEQKGKKIEKSKDSKSNHHKGERSFDQAQIRVIERLFDAKIKAYDQRFDQLQNRLIVLEDQIRFVYNKFEKQIQNVNREEIKRNVEALFEKVTPQFETYFNQIFKQISSVMEQGETYYKSKLFKSVDMHQQVLQKMVNMTFDATKQIIEVGQKDFKLSKGSEVSIQKLFDNYQKWKEEESNEKPPGYQPLKYKSPDQPVSKIELTNQTSTKNHQRRD